MPNNAVEITARSGRVVFVFHRFFFASSGISPLAFSKDIARSRLISVIAFRRLPFTTSE
jgi:hypothetical protein